MNKARASLQSVRAASRPGSVPRSLVELGNLLPTLPREYFTSASELSFRGGHERDLTTAWWCAEAAMLAYQEPHRIAPLAAPVTADGWEVRVFGHDQPTLAVLLKARDAAILAFRGTRVGGFERLDQVFSRPWLDYSDLKADAQFAPASFDPGGRVHGGILTSFRRFWKLHGTYVVDAIGHRPLYLTGHSLGAALATVAAATKQLKSTTAVYSFGSPRVGDAVFRDVLARTELPMHRFVHGNDLVSTLAPEGLLGYTHASDALHIKTDGSGIDQHEPNLADVLLNALRLTDASIRSTILNFRENRLREPLKLLVPQGALADHAPVYYVEMIRGLSQLERSPALD